MKENPILSGLLQQTAYNITYGSFSARNPGLGKMITCPFCKKRRRQAESCCNPVYKKTNKADTPKLKGRKNPRLTRNRPPLFEVHQKLVEMERQPGYIEVEGVSGIVEAEIIRRKKAKSKKKRQMQKQSRKANRVN